MFVTLKSYDIEHHSASKSVIGIEMEYFCCLGSFPVVGELTVFGA
jgi:hypothetical protein